MKKFRLYYDKDKEEIWLNEMVQKGWAMTKFFLGCYTFEPCQPKQYTYRIDMPKAPGMTDSDVEKREYIQFVKDTGAEYVCEWFFWVIFRKETALGEFKLYTDYESRIGLYQRIRRMFLWVLGIEVMAGISALRSLEEAQGGFEICIALLVGLVIFCLLKMIWNLTSKIKELEQKKRIEN